MAVFRDHESWDGSDYVDAESWSTNYSLETLEVILAETASIDIFQTATDSLTPALGESSDVFSPFDSFGAVDSATVALVESATILEVVLIVGIDVVTIVATETRAQVDNPADSRSGSDTLLAVINEAAGGVLVVFDSKGATDAALVGISSFVTADPLSTDLLYVDRQSWSVGTGYTDSVVWTALGPAFVSTVDQLQVAAVDVARIAEIHAAVDTTTVIATDATNNLLKIGVDPKSAVDTLAVVATDVGTLVDITFVTATDTLLLDLYENRSVFSGGSEVVASDTLAVGAIEALIAVQQIRTDDTVTPGFTDIGVSPDAIPISGSDTCTIALGESWTITAFGASYPTAIDTITPIASESVKSLFQFINISSSDSLLVSGVDVIRTLIRSEVRLASDNVNPRIAAEDIRLIAFEPPPEGELPPGWYSVEEEELAGIREPWLTDPHLTTHPQGWFTRAYWAVYDTNARLRVTDASRGAAHSQAWTRHHVVDKRSKPEIT